MRILLALLSGAIFGAGLAISDMVNPTRVLNFLDVAGNWDPTLAFVMAGGLAVTMPGFRLLFGRPAPLADTAFNLPTNRAIDARLIGGSAVFGLGWGLVGICPGPALAGLVTLNPGLLLFVAAMLAGMLLAQFLRGPIARLQTA